MVKDARCEQHAAAPAPPAAHVAKQAISFMKSFSMPPDSDVFHCCAARMKAGGCRHAADAATILPGRRCHAACFTTGFLPPSLRFSPLAASRLPPSFIADFRASERFHITTPPRHAAATR